MVPTAVAYLRGVKRSRVNEKKKGMKSIQEVEAKQIYPFSCYLLLSLYCLTGRAPFFSLYVTFCCSLGAVCAL